MDNTLSLKIFTICIILSFLPFLSFATVKSNKKVAFIIGNDSYGGKFNELNTCVNDANAVNSCFKNLGYETILLLNANMSEISNAYNSFKERLKNEAAEGVFYFSGHGVNIDGIQYIVPAKTAIVSNETMRNDCFDITPIQKILYKKCNYSFIFLDACRETVTIGPSGENIISPEISTTNQHNQLTCYASRFNSYAHSGSENEKLSPFTRALITHIFDKESFSAVWAQVKSDVMKKAQQEPVMEADYWILKYDFSFNPDGKYPEASTKWITINVNPASIIKISGENFESGKKLGFKMGTKYTYTIEHEGYIPSSGTINVNDYTPDVININLIKVQEARIKINTQKPKNAEVYIDGKYMGTTPLALITTSGQHEIQIKAKHYHTKTTNIYLQPDEEKELSQSLSIELPVFFDFDKWNSSLQINYHFSQKYPIGLSAMYGNINESRFSAGLIYASSIGFYKGNTSNTSFTYNKHSTMIIVTDDLGNEIQATCTTESVDSEVYSIVLDPNDEAQKYDANLVLLANISFNACNGILIEAGVGAAYHQKRYFMQHENSVLKNTIINNATGELIGEPTYTYSKTGRSRWYRDKYKWSPAIRFGARFLIPLCSGDFDEYSLTIGGGYTYVPMNHKYSSWDASIGLIIPLKL